MNRFRRRLRVRLSILAIVALLWSQVVLAGHPGCSMAAMALAEMAVPVAVDVGCHGAQPSDESSICTAHCSQDDLSGEVGRVPPIPPLAPVPAIGLALMVAPGADRAPCIGLSPAASWHRPTTHPASLLLI